MLSDDLLGVYWGVSRGTVRQWTEATAPVKPPRLLTGIVGTILGIAVLATIAAAGYRAFGPWFGATVGGPGWLNISARFGIGVLAFAGLIILCEIFSIGILSDITGEVFDIFDSSIGFSVAIILLLGSSLSCLAISVLVLNDNIGLKATIATIGSIIIVTLGLILAITRRNNRIRNPFRVYLAFTPEELARNLADSATSRRMISSVT